MGATAAKDILLRLCLELVEQNQSKMSRLAVFNTKSQRKILAVGKNVRWRFVYNGLAVSRAFAKSVKSVHSYQK